MAQPNLTDANIEYLFSKQEEHVVCQLDPLRIMWYQTKYAQIWKQKASIPAPVDEKDYRLYFLEIAELDGRLSMIQEILDDHKKVMGIVNAAKASEDAAKGQEAQQLAERAAQQVHGNSKP